VEPTYPKTVLAVSSMEFLSFIHNKDIKEKQLDEIIKLSILAVPTGFETATGNYLGAR